MGSGSLRLKSSEEISALGGGSRNLRGGKSVVLAMPVLLEEGFCAFHQGLLRSVLTEGFAFAIHDLTNVKGDGPRERAWAPGDLP